MDLVKNLLVLNFQNRFSSFDLIFRVAIVLEGKGKIVV